MPPKKPEKSKPVKKSAPSRAAAKKPAAKKHAKPAKLEKPSAPPTAGTTPGGTPAERAPKEAIPERYWEAVGRRKTSVARVRIFTKGEKGIQINQKSLAEYFPTPHLQYIANEALELMKSSDRFRATAKVYGGGIRAQAEAIRHATARALTLFNPDFRKRLKRAGFLTRDPRMKERKKFGLKGARKAPQWAKR